MQVRTVVAQWSSLLRYAGIAALFLVVYLTFLRPIKKQLLTAFRELPGRLSALKAVADDATVLPPQDGEAGALGGNKASEAQRLAGLKKQLAEKVKAEPASASRLIQGWMHEG